MKWFTFWKQKVGLTTVSKVVAEAESQISMQLFNMSGLAISLSHVDNQWLMLMFCVVLKLRSLKLKGWRIIDDWQLF